MLRRALTVAAVTAALLGFATPADASCSTFAGCSTSGSAPIYGWCRVFWGC